MCCWWPKNVHVCFWCRLGMCSIFYENLGNFTISVFLLPFWVKTDSIKLPLQTPTAIKDGIASVTDCSPTNPEWEVCCASVLNEDNRDNFNQVHPGFFSHVLCQISMFVVMSNIYVSCIVFPVIFCLLWNCVFIKADSNTNQDRIGSPKKNGYLGGDGKINGHICTHVEKKKCHFQWQFAALSASRCREHIFQKHMNGNLL